MIYPKSCEANNAIGVMWATQQRFVASGYHIPVNNYGI